MQWDHCCYSAEERLRSVLSSGDNCQSGVNIKLSSLSTSLSLSLSCWALLEQKEFFVSSRV